MAGQDAEVAALAGLAGTDDRFVDIAGTKDTAEIEVIAAGINRDAARIIALAEERTR